MSEKHRDRYSGWGGSRASWGWPVGLGPFALPIAAAVDLIKIAFK